MSSASTIINDLYLGAVHNTQLRHYTYLRCCVLKRLLGREIWGEVVSEDIILPSSAHFRPSCSSVKDASLTTGKNGSTITH